MAGAAGQRKPDQRAGRCAEDIPLADLTMRDAEVTHFAFSVNAGVRATPRVPLGSRVSRGAPGRSARIQDRRAGGLRNRGLRRGLAVRPAPPPARVRAYTPFGLSCSYKTGVGQPVGPRNHPFPRPLRVPDTRSLPAPLQILARRDTEPVREQHKE
jgi:hypothetical protein